LHVMKSLFATPDPFNCVLFHQSYKFKYTELMNMDLLNDEKCFVIIIASYRSVYTTLHRIRVGYNYLP
jgi:hypothetical protein